MSIAVRVVASLLTVAVVSGCAPSTRGPRAATPPGPVVAPSPADLPPVVQPMAPPPAPSAFAYTPGTYTYAVENVATVAAIEGEARVDTVRSRAVISYRLTAQGDSLLVAGMVDSFTVTGPGALVVGQGTTAAPQPFSFTITRAGTVRAAPRDSATACAPAEVPAVATARDLLLSVPTLLGQGARWSDSATTITCRGMIPVVTRARRDAVVEWALVPAELTLADTLAAEAAPAFRVLRASTTTIGGEGQPGGRHITITGHGSSTNALYLDPLRGVFLGSVGNAVTRLVVQSGGQRQEFEQHVRQRVVRLR